MRQGLAAVLVLASCAASLPKRLADEDPTVREKAEAEWSALAPARQFEVMREGLRGGDAETRRIAALALDPKCLTLEEIRLQMAVLAERPDELWVQHCLPVGSPDVPRIWRASLRVEPSDELIRALSEFHRAALPSHIPDLVALLPQAGPDLFPILRWQLECLADDTDEHRGEVARGLVYALSRIRAERPGGPPPRPLPTRVVEHDAFVTLAEATWLIPPDGGFGQEHIDAADVWAGAPRCWVHRWAKEIRLTAADRPFLARVAKEADQLQAQLWAARRLGELGDVAALRKIAAGDEDKALVAAAELAKRGDRARLDEMREDEQGMTMLWYADPKRAREEWLLTYREEEQEAREAVEQGEAPWTQTGLFPDDPDETEAEWGIRIAPEDIAWIGEQLAALGAPPQLFAWYYADTNPDELTAESARRVLEGLRDADPYSLHQEFLGLCEVRDRAAVVGLLEHWAGTEKGRDYALPLLAKLGEGARVEEMIATWDEWGWNERWALGRVRDRRVREFLGGKAEEDDPGAALDALSTFHGIEDPGLSWRNDFNDADWTKEPFAGARKLIVEGKPVEAVIHLAQRDELAEWAAATLAGVRDPRAIAFLRQMREEQWRGVYWVATAALATGGDAAAMAEWRAFLAEDRIWLIDWLDTWNTPRWPILTAGGDAELVRYWVSRINTNCCLKYYAYCALFTLYPTIALENEGPGDWGQKGRTIRAWLDGHRFQRSEVLGGLVPGAPARR